VSMLSGRQLTFLLALSVWLVGSSCKRTHAFAHLSSRTLLQIARDYSPSNPTGHVLAAPPLAARSKTAPETLQNEQEYKSTIKQYFSQGNFDQLEKSVREARESKGRLVGGGWKLFAFYDAINTTFIPEHPDESDWKMYLDSVKQWLAAKPDSAAAHISLAQAYVGYAWQARGGGYADSVTEEGWELYGERIALAADLLAKAARLKEKCPVWFETMQNVALAQGWDKSQARELLDQAAAFEPGFYHYYREYAYFLQPKWYGAEGEVESFAEEISDRVAGQEGEFLYFEIASLVACQCDSEKTSLQNMSWPRIKRGYAALEQLYGVSNLKRNRFASMAFKAEDKAAAHEAFAMMGDDWEKKVWMSSEKFETAKAWATSQ
jgi:hypothetical protein